MADKDDDKMPFDDKKKKKPKDGDKADSIKTDTDGADCKKSESENESLADELRKSQQKILEHLNTNDPALRKSALLAKAQDGKLSDEDSRELIAYLSGKPLEEALGDRVSKAMQPAGDLKKSMDAAPFLNEVHKSNLASHTTLAKAVEKSLATFNETAFAMASNLALLTKSQAALLDEMDALRKSHAEVLSQPVGAPRSVGVAPVVRKSQDAGATKLDDASVKDALLGLFSKSRNATEQQSYGDAISRFDAHGGAHAVPAAILAEVEQFIGANA